VNVRPSVAEVLEAVETRHGEWSEAQLIEQIAMRTTGPDSRTIADTIELVTATAGPSSPESETRSTSNTERRATGGRSPPTTSRQAT